MGEDKKGEYRKRLSISICGDIRTIFTTKSGMEIANGYLRIVIGDRGPYIEFSVHQLNFKNTFIPKETRWRIDDRDAYYIELRSKCKSRVMIYKQKRKVDYADYELSKYYISPFDLLANGRVIIEKKNPKNKHKGKTLI